MSSPLLYRQLFNQLRQWIVPKDRRHLQGFAEIVAAILQAQSGCLSHWLPYLSHRNCQARSHMGRLLYFVHNRQIDSNTFYAPLLQFAVGTFEDEALILTLDTSMLCDEFCLIELCLTCPSTYLRNKPALWLNCYPPINKPIVSTTSQSWGILTVIWQPPTRPQQMGLGLF